MERILYKLDFDASAQLVAIGIEEAMEKVRRGDVVPWRESDSIALTIRHKLRMNSQLFEDCEILVGGGDMRVTWLGKEIRFAKMESGEWKTAEIDGLLKAEAVQVEIVGDYLFARGEQEWARYAWRRPESPRGIDDVEKEFGMTLSAAHRRALLDPDDPLEEVLLPLNGEGSIFKVNEAMRRLEWKKWPGHIVAFATQGCGDYFAFDTSAFPFGFFILIRTSRWGRAWRVVSKKDLFLEVLRIGRRASLRIAVKRGVESRRVRYSARRDLGTWRTPARDFLRRGVAGLEAVRHTY